jgi:peptidoglycan/LPS O-acetylase OafA/YrhL
MDSQRNLALDGLRGVAILSVIGLHNDLLGFGWVGVQLFFVISGYLITANLIRNKRYRLSGYLADFYYRRVARIFPVYFAYLTFLALLFVIAGEPAALGRCWPYLLTYTYNLTQLRHDFAYSPWLSHFWSLCVEEQFYLVWPFCVYLLSPRSLRAVIVATIGLAPAIRAATAHLLLSRGMPSADAAHAVYWFTPAQADALAFGAAIAAFPSTARIARPFPLLCLAAGVTALLGIANLAWLVHDGLELSVQSASTLGYPRSTLAHAAHVWSYSALGVTFGLLVLCAVRGERRLAFLGHPALVFVGKVSYAAYVVHCGVILFTRRVLARAGWYSGPESVSESLLALSLSLPLTLLISFASYRWFEQRFLAQRGRYAPRDPSPSPASGA